MADLKEYVDTALQRGLSKEEIQNALKQKGYSSKEINFAFGIDPKADQIIDEEYSYVKKVTLLFSDPAGFFKKVQEPSLKNSFLLLLTVTALVAAIGIAMQMARFGTMDNTFGGGASFIGIYSSLGIILYVLSLGGTFLYAAFSYGLLKAMKGSGNYVSTYNVVAYSTVPGVIFSIIPLIGLLGSIYSIILMVFGFSEYHKISKGKASVAAIVPSAVIFILVLGLAALLLFSTWSG